MNTITFTIDNPGYTSIIIRPMLSVTLVLNEESFSWAVKKSIDDWASHHDPETLAKSLAELEGIAHSQVDGAHEERLRFELTPECELVNKYGHIWEVIVPTPLFSTIALESVRTKPIIRIPKHQFPSPAQTFWDTVERLRNPVVA